MTEDTTGANLDPDPGDGSGSPAPSGDALEDAFNAALAAQGVTRDQLDGDEPPEPADGGGEEKPPASTTAPPAKVKQAAGQTQGQGQPATPPTTQEADPPELEGQDEKVKEAYRNLPPEIRAANNKVFTQHTQRLAEQRRQLEVGERILNGLRTNPIETVRQLSREVGVRVEDPTVAAAQVTADSIAQSLAQIFPDKAKELAPILHQIVQASIAPLVEGQQQRDIEAAGRALDNELTTFATKHPDWKEHEQDILAFLAKHDYTDEVPNAQLLEDAYQFVTLPKNFDARVEARVAEEVEKKIKALGRKAGEAGAPGSSPNGGTPQTQVTNRGPALPSIDEAYAAAQRGERFE